MTNCKVFFHKQSVILHSGSTFKISKHSPTLCFWIMTTLYKQRGPRWILKETIPICRRFFCQIVTTLCQQRSFKGNRIRGSETSAIIGNFDRSFIERSYNSHTEIAIGRTSHRLSNPRRHSAWKSSSTNARDTQCARRKLGDKGRQRPKRTTFLFEHARTPYISFVLLARCARYVAAIELRLNHPRLHFHHPSANTISLAFFFLLFSFFFFFFLRRFFQIIERLLLATSYTSFFI